MSSTDHGLRTALLYEEGGLLKKRLGRPDWPGRAACLRARLPYRATDFDAIAGA